MPLKHCWLYYSLSLIIYLLLPKPFSVFWMLLSVVYFFRSGLQMVFIYLFLFILLLIRIDKPPAMQFSDSFQGSVVALKGSYMIVRNKHETRLIYNVKNVDLHDEIYINGPCENIYSQDNFYGFSFQEYMKKKNIHRSCKADTYNVIKRSKSPAARFYRFINKKEKNLQVFLKLMLYGISIEDVKLIFFVTASGMHLRLLISICYRYIKKCYSKNYANVICLLLSIILMCLFPFQITFLILIVRYALQSIFKDYKPHIILGISSILLLLIYPQIVFELSFMIPFVLRFFSFFKKKKHSQKQLNLLLIIPLQFYYFHKIDVFQLLLFPVLRRLYAALYLYAWVCVVFPFLFFKPLLFKFFSTMNIVHSYSYIFYYRASIGFLILWFFVVVYWITAKTSYALQGFVCLLIYTQTCAYFRPYLEIHMFNVGQGDSILISLPFQRGNILVDVAGHKTRDIAGDVLFPSLKSMGIHRIDKVIITHMDFDHYGGLESLQKKMLIQDVITTKEDFQLGNITFKFLLKEHEFQSLNENSLLLYFEAFHTTFLFMGDAGIEVERMLLQEYPHLNADILKVGHHGSKTSTSSSFIQQIHPRFALISCGKNNYYGHPHKEVLNTLINKNVPYAVTANNGAIQLKFSNIFRFFRTRDDRFGIIK